MGSLFHIAEVAALLLVAYMAGWSIGFLLHLAVRPRVRPEVIPAERLAAAIGSTPPADALVKAPVIVEVERTPPPVPVAAAALAAPADQPAGPVAAKVSAIDTLRSLSSAMPLLPNELASAPVQPAIEARPSAEPVGASVATAEVAAAVAEITAAALETAPPPEPVIAGPEAEIVASPPMPASAPGQAWTGRIHGHEAPSAPASEPPAEPQPLGAVVPPAPEPQPQPLAPADLPVEGPERAGDARPLVVEDPVGLEASLLSIVEAHLPAAPETAPDMKLEDALLDSVAGGLAIDAEAEAALTTPAAVEDGVTVAPAEAMAPERNADEIAPLASAVETQPEPPPLAPEAVDVTPPEPPFIPAPVEFDEHAAMRDIEGGWSRRRTRAMSDATDVGAAVAAAQVAVETVLARNGVSPDRQASLGKPRGLPGPRDGRRDNLRQINGLSPLDESTLNNLGVFHVDQIAAWTAAEVLWLENHAFARGRIGQEGWQLQAMALASEHAARRAVR